MSSWHEHPLRLELILLLALLTVAAVFVIERGWVQRLVRAYRDSVRRRFKLEKKRRANLPPRRCGELRDTLCERDQSGRRIFDLVLFSAAADADMRTIRLGEVAGCVVTSVFVETAFDFRTGSHKGVSPNASFVVEPDASMLQHCQSLEKRHRYPGKGVWRSQASFCRESYARSKLLQAFLQARID